MVLLHSRLGPRSDLDLRHRRTGPLHVHDHLVSLEDFSVYILVTNAIQGILPAPSRGSRCLRSWPDDLLEQEVGILLHRGHVHPEQ
jgi:hypothetical protein